MKKKILAYIFTGSFKNQQYIHNKLISSISKEFSKVIFIDLTFLIFKINENNKVLKKNFFLPRTYHQLDFFLSRSIKYLCNGLPFTHTNNKLPLSLENFELKLIFMLNYSNYNF